MLFIGASSKRSITLEGAAKSATALQAAAAPAVTSKSVTCSRLSFDAPTPEVARPAPGSAPEAVLARPSEASTASSSPSSLLDTEKSKNILFQLDVSALQIK